MSHSGPAAEKTACAHLERQGLRCLERNFHCRLGELDLIMQDEGELAIVEVRSRSGHGLVDAASSVTASKQRRMIAATRHWLSRNPRWHEHPLRFDVVALDGEHLRWIRNAFEAPCA